MTTIDKLDISIYVQYARRTQLIEQINRQYNLTDAATIPPQTQLVDFYPKLSEMELLLGITPTVTPWALFTPPMDFGIRRRSPFGFAKILPSFSKESGEGEDEEEEDEDEMSREERKLAAIQCQTEEEEEERKILYSCFDQVRKINEWLGHIVGRIGQFLQG